MSASDLAIARADLAARGHSPEAIAKMLGETAPPAQSAASAASTAPASYDLQIHNIPEIRGLPRDAARDVQNAMTQVFGAVGMNPALAPALAKEMAKSMAATLDLPEGAAREMRVRTELWNLEQAAPGATDKAMAIVDKMKAAHPEEMAALLQSGALMGRRVLAYLNQGARK